MMKFAALLLLACLHGTRGSSTTTVSVATCADLQQAAAYTSTYDVEAQVESATIACDDWTTLEITNNRLKLVWVGEDTDDYIRLYNVRFLVTSGVLRSDMPILLDPVDSDVTQSVDGGLLYVAEGARARFMQKSYFADVVVSGSPTGEGGCIHNEGLIRFEAEVGIAGCQIIDTDGTVEVTGAGMWNGETGQVVVKGFLNMGDSHATVATDSINSRGGAIYNKGKVSVFGGAEFDYITANIGGSIYNEGVFKFLKGTDPILFTGGFLRETGRGAGHVYNSGTILFKSGATFDGSILWAEDSDGGSVINYGTFSVSEPAEFLYNQAERYGGAIYTTSDATLDLPDNTVWELNYVTGNYGINDCDNIYLEQEDGYTCLP